MNDKTKYILLQLFVFALMCIICYAAYTIHWILAVLVVGVIATFFMPTK